jgi:carbonic anhydrase
MAAAPHPSTGPGPDQALRELMAGNKRYVAAKSLRPHQATARRADVAKGQHPFAIVLGCADSRVPPEIVFDQGLGDMFVVRVAGNIADDAALASMEYAVEHLGPRLIVVLGHERCGAVDAAVKGGEAPGHLGSLITAIAPAVASSQGKPGDRLDNAVRANVVRVVEQLRSSEPILAAQVRAGKVQIVGCRYDLDTGAVEILR